MNTLIALFLILSLEDGFTNMRVAGNFPDIKACETVKEKILAAHRAGLTTIILPKSNTKDLEDIPKNVRHDLQFILAEHMDEVLKVALTKSLPKENLSTISKKKKNKKSENFILPQTI